MPKHLLLFALFLALLVAIFYHPIPDPAVWDADSRHLAMPEYPLLENNVSKATKSANVTNAEKAKPLVSDWVQQLEHVYEKQQNQEMISALP